MGKLLVRVMIYLSLGLITLGYLPAQVETPVSAVHHTGAAVTLQETRALPAAFTCPKIQPVPPISPTAWLTQGIDPAQLTGAAIIGIFQPIFTVLCTTINSITKIPPGQDFFLSTGADITYNNPVVMKLSDASLIIATLFLALILTIGGLNVMAGERVTALLPRVALAAIASFAAPTFIRFAINLENAMCGVALANGWVAVAVGSPTGDQGGFLQALLGLFQGGAPTSGGLPTTIVTFIDIFMFLGISIQLLVRVGALDLLTVLASLAMMCYALPQWQRWAVLWTTGFIAVLSLQFFDDVAISLGGGLVATVGGGGSIIGMLIGIADLVLVFSLPRWLGSVVTNAVGEVPSVPGAIGGAFGDIAVGLARAAAFL
jgi:hypothetical protein